MKLYDFGWRKRISCLLTEMLAGTITSIQGDHATIGNYATIFAPNRFAYAYWITPCKSIISCNNFEVIQNENDLIF
jgi:hypothetical protein